MLTLRLHVFSTVMSPKDVLKVENWNIHIHGYNAGTPIAIPIYAVLPYCVIYTGIVCMCVEHAGIMAKSRLRNPRQRLTLGRNLRSLKRKRTVMKNG